MTRSWMWTFRAQGGEGYAVVSTEFTPLIRLGRKGALGRTVLGVRRSHGPKWRVFQVQSRARGRAVNLQHGTRGGVMRGVRVTQRKHLHNGRAPKRRRRLLQWARNWAPATLRTFLAPRMHTLRPDTPCLRACCPPPLTLEHAHPLPMGSCAWTDTSRMSVFNMPSCHGAQVSPYFGSEVYIPTKEELEAERKKVAASHWHTPHPTMSLPCLCVCCCCCCSATAVV